MNNFPRISTPFWIIKICITMLGEMVGLIFCQALDNSYASLMMILISLLFLVLIKNGVFIQQRFVSYWINMLAASITGTMLFIFMDKAFELDFITNIAILIFIFSIALMFVYLLERKIITDKPLHIENNISFWLIIIFANTIGYSFSDFLIDNFSLHFSDGTMFIISLLILIVSATFFTKISRVFLFWSAFVLTQPLGTTFNDLLLEPIDKGGLGISYIDTSLALLIILIGLLLYSKKDNNIFLRE